VANNLHRLHTHVHNDPMFVQEVVQMWPTTFTDCTLMYTMTPLVCTGGGADCGQQPHRLHAHVHNDPLFVQEVVRIVANNLTDCSDPLGKAYNASFCSPALTNVSNPQVTPVVSDLYTRLGIGNLDTVDSGGHF
jgi:hypothetical protein